MAVPAEYVSLSNYLMSICNLMVDGNMKLAKELAVWVYDFYKHLPGNVSKYSLTEYLRIIAFEEEDWKRTAERAMTASIILKSRVGHSMMNV